MRDHTSVSLCSARTLHITFMSTLLWSVLAFIVRASLREILKFVSSSSERFFLRGIFKRTAIFTLQELFFRRQDLFQEQGTFFAVLPNCVLELYFLLQTWHFLFDHKLSGVRLIVIYLLNWLAASIGTNLDVGEKEIEAVEQKWSRWNYCCSLITFNSSKNTIVLSSPYYCIRNYADNQCIFV